MVKIIASLTTIPSRIDLIFATIQSILNQTIPIDSIEVNIPFIFKRTGETYEIPEWLIDLEKSTKNSKCEVRIFRTEDYGAITKIAPTLLRYKDKKDTYIWSVDDDFVYPENMVAVLYREFRTTTKYVLSHSGGFWKYNVDSKECVGYNSFRREGFVDFIEGFASVLYPSFIIQRDFEDYVIKTSETVDCRNSDDVIISNYLKMKNIKMYNCSYPITPHKTLFDGSHASYSANADALHRQGGGNIPRYIRVLNWLKDCNLNAWETRTPIQCLINRK